MKLITVSRDYGAGGRGRPAAGDALGWDLLDHELLHRAAKLEHLPDSELEPIDEQAINLADRFRLHPPHQRYIHGLAEAAHQAVAQGRAILVGRWSRQLVGEISEAFHLRLVASRGWRVQRMATIEDLPLDVVAARCLEVDRARERFTKYFFGPTASLPCQYHLVVNTGRVPLDEVVALVTAVIRDDSTSNAVPGTVGERILTLRANWEPATPARATLADRLGLRCYDRALLEQEAVRLGVREVEAEKIDENPAGSSSASGPGSLHRATSGARQLMNDLALRGDVLLVGRGRELLSPRRPGAFHVRLVATAGHVGCGG